MVAVLVATATAAAQSDGSPMPSGQADEAEQLPQLERQRLEALVDADVEVVEAIHADDFQLIPPPGFELSRDWFVPAVASGELDYPSAEPISQITVRLYGDGAVLTYQSLIDVEAPEQGRVKQEIWHTNVWERRDGQWQVVWEQATGVGGFPPRREPEPGQPASEKSGSRSVISVRS
jgi:hypothetical protein